MDPEEAKKKAPVPKFSSFKPTGPSHARDQSRQNHDTGSTGTSRDRDSRERHVDRTRDRSHERRRKRSRDRHRHRSSHAEDERKKPKADAPLVVQSSKSERDDTSLYFVDKVGDRNNLVYGSLHRYDVPLYRRSGRGRVLGLPPGHRIDRESEDGKSLIVLSQSRALNDAKLRGKNAFWKLAAKDTRVYRVRPQSDTHPGSGSEKDYLPVSSHGSRKRRRLQDWTLEHEHDADRSGDDFGPDYRSIEGRAKRDTDPDIISESDLDAEDEIPRKRNAELSRLTSEHPEDVDTWLQLIDHQESLVGRISNDGHRLLTAAEKRSIADIKLSLYDKALQKITSGFARDRLLLGMMEEGSKVWDTKTLSTKWQKILQSNLGSVSLWVKYMDFQQTQFLDFTYERCKTLFVECLKLNPQRDHFQNRHINNLYVLLRLSLLMREAGFAEHALSLWQAVLEFNFRRPEGLDVENDLTTARSSFAEFWDSEVGRIGESGANGWDSPDNDEPSPKADPQIESSQGVEFDLESWIGQEESCAYSSRLPARTLDDVREDDPYRVILSSDVVDFLIPFSSYGLSSLLINSFLIFCHLPPLVSQANAEVISQWSCDPFFCNTLLDRSGGSPLKWFSENLSPSDPSEQSSALGFSPYNFINTTDTLLSDGNKWFSAFKEWKETYASENSGLDTQWVLQTLRQLVQRLPENEELAEYAVALEFVFDKKEGSKYAKGLLRKRPSSVKLYNVYAMLEARSGRLSSAEQVWTTTLTMNQTFGEEARVNCIPLWRSWAWEALYNDQPKKALRLLLSISSQGLNRTEFLKDLESTVSINPAEFLKVQQFLTEVQSHALTFRKAHAFANSTECLALLLYLFQYQDIENALSIYHTSDTRLETESSGFPTASELIHQAKAKLLHHHSRTTNYYKPLLARDELIKSISRFPNNTIFLSLFAWNESRFRIADRVRSVLSQHTQPSIRDGATGTSTPSKLIPHLFSVYTELHRGVSAGSTVHSARAAFETTVTSDSGVCSAAAWKLYVHFELTLGDRGRAKDVFYRSIRACPWAKELVLLAFREDGLRNNMRLEELRKVWNVLVEKELRIHVDLEEWFEKKDQELETSGSGGRRPIMMPDDQSSDEETGMR